MEVSLMQHQKDGINFILNNKGIGALHWEPGTGKTCGSLSIYSVLKETEPDLKLLVICPISLIHGAWVKEIEKFTDFKWLDIHGKTSKQKYFPCCDSNIYIVNFEHLVSKSNFEELKNFLSKSPPFMCVVDESAKMKNYKGVITSRLIGDWENKKFIPGIKSFCKYRLELTGTPAPNIEWEYWAQMKFLGDAILGGNFYKFRNKYFNLSRGREIVPGAVYNKAALRELFNNGYKYEFDESNRQDFFDRLKPWCHVVKAKDCLDLPKTVDEYRMFDMEGDQLRVYKEMKTEYIAEIKEEIKNPPMPTIMDCTDDPVAFTRSVVVANIILTRMLKLHQITSGFAIDDTGTPRAISTKVPEKLKILLEIIEEIGSAQLIVWCQFKWEIKCVVNALKEIAGVSELHGGIEDKERINHLDDFISGKNRFLIAHVKSASHGLTLVNCRYQVFYSMDASYENYEQARKRTHRKGQTEKCVYFHILARNSVDEDFLSICQKKAGKQDVAERFMKG